MGEALTHAGTSHSERFKFFLHHIVYAQCMTLIVRAVRCTAVSRRLRGRPM